MWRIYYDDASTFDSGDGESWEAPGRGVVCIVQHDPDDPRYSVNTQILKEHPYYWYHIEWGYWMGSDRDGVLDQLLSDRNNVVVAIKQGRWTRYDQYRDILEKAHTDSDFYEKSGESTAEMRYQQ
jgi:hypothetical protein